MKKKFDCVKMKHEIQEKLYNELKPISGADFIDKLIEKARKIKVSEYKNK